MGEARSSRRQGRSFLGTLLALVLLLPACWTTTSSTPEVDPVALAAAIRDIGLDQLDQGNYAMAIRKLQEAQAMNSDDPLTYFGLGEAFRSKGLVAQAEANLLRSLEISPDPHAPNYQRAVLTLAAVYIQQERYSEAEEQCQILIDDPTYSAPWIALTNRGWAQYKSGRLQAARESYREALEFRSDDPLAHFNLGILSQDQSRWLDAIRAFERAVKAPGMPSNFLAEVHFRMGEIYMTLGEKAEALEHFGIALEEAPEGQWGEKSRAYLEILL